MKSPLNPQLVRVPKDLGSVTKIDYESEVAPQSVGVQQQTVDDIWASVERLYKSGAYPGLSLAVRHKGELILNRAIGHARGNGPKDDKNTPKMAMLPETPVCLFSSSKAITALLVHKLAEEGLIKLHHPVAEYIPEFAQRGKQYITIGQMLSHRAGIPTVEAGTDPSIMWDWEAVQDMLNKAVPRRDMGRAQAYHAITGGFILGEVMRRASGLELDEIITTRIREPLGSEHLTFGMPKDKQDIAAYNYATGFPEPFPISAVIKNILGASVGEVTEISNSPEFMSGTIPAGNMYGTAKECCDFYQCLLNGGKFNGKRVFERATVARAVNEASPRQFDRTLLLPLRTSEGLMLGDAPFGMYGPQTSEAFGHLGFMTILTWGDPVRDISVSLLNTGKPRVAPQIPALINFLKTVNYAFPR